jgi:dienelactone hydrolase
MPLPTPTGPCAVGTIDLQLTDDSRPRHLASDLTGRCMQIRLWYPADPHAAANQGPELAWSDLRRDQRTPGVVRAMLSLLRSRSTARPGAPVLSQLHAPAPIIYHHGFISFAAENESLMEMAASHGHLVISIQHMDQLTEFQTLQRLQAAPARKAAARLESQLIRASAAGRALLAREYYTASANTNRIVMERAADTAFVLENMDQVHAALPGAPTTPAESSVHLMGFSVGGAVATAVAQRSQRALSVVNIDGGTQGVIDATAVRAPYLMLYSAANAGINDALLPQHAQRTTVEGTRHLNFHDVAGLIPALRFTPALGKGDPLRRLQQRNDIVCSFLSLAAK